MNSPSTSRDHSFDKWEAQGSCGTPDVTNFRTAPYQALLVGVFKGTITLSGPKDLSGDDLFTLGQDLTIRLYWTAAIYLLYVGVVSDYRLSQDVKDAGRAQITMQTTGTLSVALSVDGTS